MSKSAATKAKAEIIISCNFILFSTLLFLIFTTVFLFSFVLFFCFFLFLFLPFLLFLYFSISWFSSISFFSVSSFSSVKIKKRETGNFPISPLSFFILYGTFRQPLEIYFAGNLTVTFFNFQISFAYSAIVLSAVNLPTFTV